MKRIFVILSLSVYFFASSFVYPRQEAQAIVLEEAAAVAGVEVGVGAYVLGAIAVGGLATALGMDYGPQIMEHATDVWNGANQLVKDSIKASINAAAQAGSKVVKISQDVANWIKSEFSKTYPQYFSQPDATEGYIDAKDSNTLSIRAPSGYVWVTYSTYYGCYVYSEIVRLTKYSGYAGKYLLQATNVNTALTGGSYDVLTYFDQSIWNKDVTKITTPFAARELMASWTGGLVPVLMSVSAAQSFKSSLQTNKDVWDSQIDAVTSGAMSSGIYVPFDDIKAYPVDATTGMRTSDIPLTWDNTTKTWKTAQGGTYTGSIDWSFPIPDVATDGKVVVHDTTVGDVVAVGDAVGTTVTTGEDTTTGEDSPTKNPDVEANRWKELVTTKFPFSLPWDLYAILSVLNAEPRKPVLKLDATGHIAGMTVPLKFTQNIDFLDPYVPYFRTFLKIGYVLFLIFSTRKLLGGGQ